MFHPSPLHILVVLVVIVLLFGTKRLPEFGSSLGEAIGNFRKSLNDSKAIDVTPKGEEEQKKAAEQVEQKL